MKRKPEDTISLHGLTLAPSQILHGMRVVPLLRKQVRGDLRLAVHELDGVAAVQLAKKRVYVADEPTPFLPHALFVEYGPDQRPLATFGAELGNHERRAHPGMRVLHRMVKRRTGTSFRFLPLHLAMEGLLARHFGGPDVMRAEFTQEFLRYGMQRAEAVTFAADPKLAQVLATFEIHVGQVGCLLFGGDDLICAFVVPHPDDYRMLHDSLLLDFFAEPILHYTGPLFGDYGQKLVQSLLDNTQAANLEQLRILHRSLREQWAQMHAALATDLLHRKATFENVRSFGPFALRRFCTALDLDDANHIGELIARDSGEVEYLKTYRLSDGQTRRAFLLQEFARHGWNFAATCQALRCTPQQMHTRLLKADLAHYFRPHVFHDNA